MNSSLDNLNRDELFMILKDLEYNDLLSFCLTCKKYYNTIWKRNEIWHYKKQNVTNDSFSRMIYTLQIILNKVHTLFPIVKNDVRSLNKNTRIRKERRKRYNHRRNKSKKKLQK